MKYLSNSTETKQICKFANTETTMLSIPDGNSVYTKHVESSKTQNDIVSFSDILSSCRIAKMEKRGRSCTRYNSLSKIPKSVFLFHTF